MGTQQLELGCVGRWWRSNKLDLCRSQFPGPCEIEGDLAVITANSLPFWALNRTVIKLALRMCLEQPPSLDDLLTRRQRIRFYSAD